MVNVLKSMREKGLTRIDPKDEAEKEWKATVRQLHARSLRDKVDGWYNGAVSLTVFDCMAKLISVLEHSRKTKGTFELCWWDSTVYQDDHGMLREQLRRIRRLIGGAEDTLYLIRISAITCHVKDQDCRRARGQTGLINLTSVLSTLRKAFILR